MIEQAEHPILIRPEELSPEAIEGVIENFILREGTDYGVIEVSFDEKARRLRCQIDSGKIKIIFDRASQTVSLVKAEELGQQTLRP